MPTPSLPPASWPRSAPSRAGETTPAGLTPAQVVVQRQRYGANTLAPAARNHLLGILRGIGSEPMFILLVVTALVYGLIGSYPESITMLAATILVAGISLYQEARSDRALRALQQLTQPRARVHRAGQETDIPSAEVVVGDVLRVAEGEQVVADGMLLQANDLQADESFLTGESLPVAKAADGQQRLYAGSSVSGGSAVLSVTAVGPQTRLGRIGGLINQVKTPPTPLQRQVASFVRRMALVGAGAFALVFSFNWWESGSFVHGLLHGLTLAMAVLPEEIPVALSSFMALGAWRLMRRRLLTKKPQTVETLGSATVICVDKTGTLTENRMRLDQLYCPGQRSAHPFRPAAAPPSEQEQGLLETAMWASEPHPFDPMEQALHRAYGEQAGAADRRPAYQLVHEYPLGGRPPMMTHVFAAATGHRLVAAKGAPEGIIARCALAEPDPDSAQAALQQ
ncbi:HAD-IC family P-type ATPase, partial [Hymenobacter tenuis]